MAKKKSNSIKEKAQQVTLTNIQLIVEVFQLNVDANILLINVEKREVQDDKGNLYKVNVETQSVEKCYMKHYIFQDYGDND